MSIHFNVTNRSLHRDIVNALTFNSTIDGYSE